PRLVQGGGHLRGPRAVLPGFGRGRDRRLPRADREAGPHRLAGGHRGLDPALLSLSTPRRWLRHRRLLWRPSLVRAGRERSPAGPRGPPARAEGDHRTGLQPHLGPASLVPAGAVGPPRERVPGL